MIDPDETGGGRAAPGAWAGMVFHLNFFGLDAADEKEEDTPPPWAGRV